jgi:hypothetical protein
MLVRRSRKQNFVAPAPIPFILYRFVNFLDINSGITLHKRYTECHFDSATAENVCHVHAAGCATTCVANRLAQVAVSYFVQH